MCSDVIKTYIKFSTYDAFLKQPASGTQESQTNEKDECQTNYKKLEARKPEPKKDSQTRLWSPRRLTGRRTLVNNESFVRT